MVYDEDRSQVRTAAGPQIMASLRNLALAALRLPEPPTSPPHSDITPDDHTDHSTRS
jgi:hypothetical protein